MISIRAALGKLRELVVLPEVATLLRRGQQSALGRLPAPRSESERAKVITTSGLYGQVMKIGDVSVQLQIADKVRIDVAKASIGGFQGQDPVVKENGGL